MVGRVDTAQYVFPGKIIFYSLTHKEKQSRFQKAPIVCSSSEGCGPHRSHILILRKILGRISLCHGKVGISCRSIGTYYVAGRLASCSGRMGIV